MQGTNAADSSKPWYSAIDRSQWNTLLASNLGWMFDGYETYALILTIGAALHQLLEPSQYAQIPKYAAVGGVQHLGGSGGGPYRLPLGHAALDVRDRAMPGR